MIEYLDSDSFSIQYASPAFILITCHPSQLLQIFGHRVRNLKFARNVKFATSKTLVNFMKKTMFLSKNWYFSVQKALIYYTVNKSHHNSFILLVFSHVANFRYVANFRFLTLLPMGFFLLLSNVLFPVFPSVLFFNLKSALIITFILCRLYFAIKTTNGGRLQIKSYSSGTTFNTETRYYSGRTLTRGFTFQFDYDPPHHCLTACSAKMLDVPAYTKEVLSDIFVTFVLSILEELFSHC